MANALGELFSDIANAIREKTGNPGMMKPIEFPEQIATIDMGADTFDATATEYDLASGATAYVGGEKITGALEVHHTAQAEAEEVYDSGGSVKMSLTNQERAIYDSGAVITVSAPLEEFGDATAEDVAVGKTFTSADGMLVVGTADTSGGDGGGSSGGGTLPAGVYLSASDIKNPTNYRHKRFMFNGELYAGAGNVAGGGYLHAIYKWNGSAWVTLLSGSSTTADLIGGTMDSILWKCVEYNGKLHMIESKCHYVFDGTNLTRSTNLPYGETSACVCNGKLYVYSDSGSSKSVYEWDDDNSAWNTVVNFSSYAGKIISYGDQLYFVSSNTITKYVDGKLTEWGTAPGITNEWVSVGDTMYCLDKNSSKFYKVNFETMEFAEMGLIPRFYYYYFTENANELSSVGVTHSTNNYHVFFIVNIIE